MIVYADFPTVRLRDGTHTMFLVYARDDNLSFYEKFFKYMWIIQKFVFVKLNYCLDNQLTFLLETSWNTLNQQ